MGQVFRAEDDPMDFMRALVTWHEVSFSVDPKGDWRRAMDLISVKTDKTSVGRVFVTMDREDEMTDSIAYFSVRCEDLDDAQGCADLFNGVLRTPEPMPPPRPAPEWMKN